MRVVDQKSATLFCFKIFSAYLCSMEEKKTYHDWLFEETEEEKAINKKLDEERARYEATDAYKEHDQKIHELFEELKVAARNRREEAKKHRPRRKPVKKVDMDEFRRENERRYQEKFNAYPEALQRAITAFHELRDDEKRVFHQDTWVYEPKYEQLENPQTKTEDIRDLLDILVQTTIDFINERGLKDIDAVGFGADSLQESAKYEEWTPATDASIHVTGIGYETSKDGTKFAVVKKIGEYM